MDITSHSVKKTKWICCQIGAREHYVIPHELQTVGQLELLITDYWTKHRGTKNIHSPLFKNLRGRRNEDIHDNKVASFNLSYLFFEMFNKASGSTGWESVMRRNDWFQNKAVDCLKSLKHQPTHLFSYSYAAKDIFKYAKSKGWTTVLGQIDPGPLEEEIVMKELQKFPEYQSEWQPAPKAYWENWLEECELADKIIVNSEWSAQALLQKGINKDKIQIIPLNYAVPEEAKSFKRNYPLAFNRARPLRILFLGQVILRKGIARIIEAAQLLLDKPVEFIIAGPIGIHPVPKLPNLKWVGRVPRLEAIDFFKEADVFLFPSLSDGYGLTQLEARAWQLPLIVSEFCGKVVTDQYDGWILEKVDAESIKRIINDILEDPALLSKFSSNISYHSEVRLSELLEEEL